MKRKKFSETDPFEGKRSLIEALREVFENEVVREDAPNLITKLDTPGLSLSDFERIPVPGRDFLAQTFNRFKKLMKENKRVS